MGGIRLDGREDLRMPPFSAQGSVAWKLARATQVQFGIGKYAQLHFPDFEFGQGMSCSGISSSYQRSNHYSGAVEQRVGENTRVRVQIFDRQSREFTVTSGGQQCPFPLLEGTRQPVRNYSRGVQVMLQRRSANRLSGWVGYTFARANVYRSEEHTSELQSRENLVCRLLLEKKNFDASLSRLATGRAAAAVAVGRRA